MKRALLPLWFAVSACAGAATPSGGPTAPAAPDAGPDDAAAAPFDAAGVGTDAGGDASADARPDAARPPDDGSPADDTSAPSDAMTPDDATGVSDTPGGDVVEAPDGGALKDTEAQDADADDAGPPPAPGPSPFGARVWGLSQMGGSTAALGAELGVGWLRPTLSWRSVQPVLEPAPLTLAEVQDAAVVSAWAAERDWSKLDAVLQAIVDGGLRPLPIVGHGFEGTLPRVDGEPADPDRLGKDQYLARQYLVTRAMVERYDGDGVDDVPSGLRVDLWQTENELNQAMLTAVLGWRTPTFLDGMSSAWADWEFLTQLLGTLRAAVLDADPTALTTTNFHTDIHASVSADLGVPSWSDAVAQWAGDAGLMDIASLDAYPNYYQAEPVAGAVVGARVTEVGARSGGMPVLVMETGYPTGPAERGYSDANQATFLADAVSSALAAGAMGFIWFGTQTADTHSVEVTPADLELIAALATAFEAGDTQGLIAFVLENPDLANGHLRDVLLTVESYWGLVRTDGTHKPAWTVLHDTILADPAE